MNMNLRDYLLADRQWPRQHRISHAKYMLKQATTPTDKQFWRSVIDANVGD